MVVGLGACTVYAPMQPTMPLLDAKGQAEFSGSLQPNGRVEATAAYSPAAHLLLTAGGTVRPKLEKVNFLVTRQYELGVGGYLPLGTAWQLNGIGGYGQAFSHRSFLEDGFFIASSRREYRARYHKYFAQAGIAHVDDWNNFGFTYRLTQVRFSSLTDAELGKLPLTNMLRHEAMFFWRRPFPRGYNWETLATVGLSIGPRLEPNDFQNPYGPTERAANHTLRSVLFTSLGLVYHPAWGGR
ncbi:hypothetical protein BEN47_18650 [Hymenobacter lapidarius]|uniref:Outer membrane protein beta-barrel domain-containing protein n=2 Tax=Hymenobacter lapidarius TaxID=1908237 RepID=A0A1G1SUA6_9BACT|nr:hypothetical protein BEN47_18650 [Hymenobacter lapidarius]